MASGNFRYRPRFQFWGLTIMSVIMGVGAGWRSAEAGFGDVWNALPSLLFGCVVAWFCLRRAPWPDPDQHVYVHPVLGVWAGVAAMIATVVFGGSALRAVLVGVGLGLAWGLANLVLFRHLVSNDPPGSRRPIPTITGWRDPSSGR